MTTASYNQQTRRLMKTAFILSIITIVYNIGEGVVSAIFGYADDTLALFGFGLDSFVEVISGLGVGHMVWRMMRSPVSEQDRFERRALYVTGGSFFLLAAGLVAASVINIVNDMKPATTLAGIIISAISIATMWALYSYKMKTGRKLGSAPIIADANCTKTCFYLSFILLGSSILYELFRIGYIDIIGSLGIAWFAFREGRESIEKAGSKSLSCPCHDRDCRE
jgi:divalent metal cation (Fe/Co/Zn/Cd) transporter